jgi:hypothetical protein
MEQQRERYRFAVRQPAPRGGAMDLRLGRQARAGRAASFAAPPKRVADYDLGHLWAENSRSGSSRARRTTIAG